MVDNQITLGIIGYNEGNGHPYSFSAIINGYDKDEMQKSEFPVIYNYLEKQERNEIGISGINVKYIWTPDIERSIKISKCTYIEYVLNDYSEMIGKVDAVIIARDDAETHRKISKIFLENKIKIFIDKPLCNTLDDLKYFDVYLRKGLIFTTSGFRYHPFVQKFNFEESTYVFNTFNDWFKYGIHVLEAAYALNKSKIVSVQNIGEGSDDLVIFKCENNSKIIINRNDNIRSFEGYLVDNQLKIEYKDNFTYFKNMLLDFKNFLNNTRIQFDYSETLNLIEALIKARISKEEKSIIQIYEFR